MSTAKWEPKIDAVSALADQDHTTDVVPLSERRGPVTLGLLWITMVTGFPSVLIGFDWYREGITLPQVLVSVLLSCLLLLAYSVPACYLGAKSGLTYGLLSRSIFGRWGSRLVSFNLVWVTIAWYGLTAIFLADALKGLFHLNMPTVLIAVLLAMLMCVNNFFGFSGVTNFAGYLAAPVLIAWVGFTFFKAVSVCPSTVLHQAGHLPLSHCLTQVSAFVIGYGIWGNEADYWRYSKPKISHSLIPLIVSITIGQVIFPATGWMIASMTGVTDYAGATSLMNQYAFGGSAIIAAIVLAVSYFAVNDSQLYAAINSLENIKEMPRSKVVFGLMLSGVLAAIILCQYTKAFDLVAALSSIFLPSATVIIMVEWFLVKPITKHAEQLNQVPSFEDLPFVRWPAVIALVVGCVVGVITSGTIPALEGLHVGVSSLQAWAVAFCVYLPLRLLEYGRELAYKKRLEELLSVVEVTIDDVAARDPRS